MSDAMRVLVVTEQLAGETGRAQAVHVTNDWDATWARLRQECADALSRGLVFRVTVGAVPERTQDQDRAPETGAAPLV